MATVCSATNHSESSQLVSVLVNGEGNIDSWQTFSVRGPPTNAPARARRRVASHHEIGGGTFGIDELVVPEPDVKYPATPGPTTDNSFVFTILPVLLV